MRALRRFTVRAQLPEQLAPLQKLATNLRWSWHPPTQDLFQSIDAELWDRSRHDPVRMLGAVASSRLEELAKDGEFLSRLDDLHHKVLAPPSRVSAARPAAVPSSSRSGALL